MSSQSKKRNQIESMFAHAVVFEHAASILTKRQLSKLNDPAVKADSRVPFHFASSLMNASFALEIYLKCLLLMQGQKKKGHKLVKLFRHLDVNTQKLIRLRAEKLQKDELKLLNNQFGPTIAEALVSSFDDALDKSSECFELIRYIYEPESLSSFGGFCAQHIQEAIKEEIISVRPELEKYIPADWS